VKLALMAFDYPDGTMTIALIPVLAIGLAFGWRVTKRQSTSSTNLHVKLSIQIQDKL
jgi:L-asparagine permease